MATAPTASALESLPPRLIRFFVKYPPTEYSTLVTGQSIPTIKQRVTMGSKPLSATKVPQESSIPTSIPAETEGLVETDTISSQPTPPTASSSAASSAPPNPFLPYKNPATGRWRGARLGLRKQADLYKLAREHDVEDWLPASIKSSQYKQQRALERGLAVKGTGEGQTVKGHKWERQMGVTIEKRKKAMEGMPELIRLWEQKGHGRGWKKYPSK